MRSILLASVFVMASAAQPAFASECSEMKAAHGDDNVWACHLAYNDGQRGRSKSACFLDVNEGFRWMQHESGKADGQIYQESCAKPGETMTLREWINRS